MTGNLAQVSMAGYFTGHGNLAYVSVAGYFTGPLYNHDNMYFEVLILPRYRGQIRLSLFYLDFA